MRPPPPATPDDPRNEAYWREWLSNPDSFVKMRRFLRMIPTEPRCQLCAAPFAGAGAPVMRLIGKGRSGGNPKMCNTCQGYMIRYHGGAEVPGTMMFADIRGSTSIAEHSGPREFSALLDRFYTVASKAVFANNGIVDKFVGDEVVAGFPPMLGANHVQRAVDAARDLLGATGHADPGGPWVPVGAAVHTGQVWFGAVGEGEHAALTILGDPVNVTARLASAAAAGEILVSADAATVIGLDGGLPRRTLELKGKEETVEVVSLTVGSAGSVGQPAP
jgi:adenylate cyclase